jgi:hypothetical protein
MSEIRKVVLYKHGVGYFEREAQVSGNAEVRLGFRAEEMNDVLKSLTVFDSGAGTVSSVSYDNQKPISKLLEETSLNIAGTGGQLSLLQSVRGASVLVSAGSRMVSGQVVGIDERSAVIREVVVNSQRLTVLDEAATLHSFELSEVSSIRFLDDHLKSELKHLFDTLLSATRRDTKNLKLFARGEGDRTLSISYVVECPIWKTSYRIAISQDDAEQPFLQGWALVDNPQDEDWNEVRLSLVSGLPISFTHDLYSPRYLRRKEIEVEREAAAGPVMTEAAMMPAAAMLQAPMASFASMEFGIAAEPAPAATSGAVGARAQKLASSQHVQTVTQSVGELFEYAISQPVTVLRNQSALVPIVGSSFEGGRKSLYNRAHREQNPFAVIDFKNTTGLTLEGGPLTVFEGDVYAGEAMMDTLSPGEERMIPYAVDLGVEAKVEQDSEQVVVLETLLEGVWTQQRAHYSRTRYRFHNKSERAKELIIEHEIESGELVGTPAPLSESRSYWRFPLALPARAASELSVTVRHTDQDSYTFSTANPSWILSVLSGSRAGHKLNWLKEQVQRAAAKMAASAEKDSQVRQKIQEIAQTQTRLRENLGRLGPSDDEARLRSRYVQQLEAQEDELARLQEELTALAERRNGVANELREEIRGVKFEQLYEESPA